MSETNDARDPLTGVVVQATCPACGTVEMPPKAVRLVICNVPTWSYYEFFCPDCGDPVRKDADLHTVELLKRGYVIPEYRRVPAEVTEVHVGAPLTKDDLLDLVLALDGTDHLAALADGTPT